MKKIVLSCAMAAIVAASALSISCEKGKDPEPDKGIRVARVLFWEREIEMIQGTTRTLVPVIRPTDATNRDVTWKSDKPEVVDIVDGVAVAVSEGTARITVTTKDGGHTDVCNVLVHPPFPFGKVSFLSEKTWTVGEQVWSDAVTAVRCKKDTYRGGEITGTSGGFNFDNFVDCRQSVGHGDLFSWLAVSIYHEQLCADGWRVPYSEDFLKLNRAFGGQSVKQGDRYLDPNVESKFANTWGGTYGGYAVIDPPNILESVGTGSYYWSRTQSSLNPDTDHLFGVVFYFGEYGIFPEGVTPKFYGMQLRCIK